MSSNLKYSAVLKNAQMAAITTTVGTSALILIYSGTQPANPDAGIGAAVLLATLACSATFAPAPSAGVLTLNAITSGTGTAGASTGTAATWFRITTSGGTAHVDGTCGVTSGFDMNFVGSATIATGQTVSDSSFSLTNGN
jgi:hypothetical protein